MTLRHLKEEMEALKKALEAEKEKTAQAIATANSKKEDEGQRCFKGDDNTNFSGTVSPNATV